MFSQIIPFMEACPTPGDIVLTYTTGNLAGVKVTLTREGKEALAAPPPETSLEVSHDSAQIVNASIVCQIDNDVDSAPVANLDSIDTIDSIDSIDTSTPTAPLPPLIDLRYVPQIDATFDSVRFMLAEPPQVLPLPPLIDLRDLRDVPSTNDKVTLPGRAELCTFTC